MILRRILGFFLFLLFTGIIAANFFGRRLVALWERILARIPLVRSIYSAASAAGVARLIQRR